MEKANYVSAAIGGARRLLVLDDMVTMGTTASKIAAAVKTRSPTIEVVSIALGKTERRSYAAERGYNIGNGDVPAAWAQRWDQS
jgi:hypoxanthine-guanine phosphoribosyltransferase